MTQPSMSSWGASDSIMKRARASWVKSTVMTLLMWPCGSRSDQRSGMSTVNEATAQAPWLSGVRSERDSCSYRASIVPA